LGGIASGSSLESWRFSLAPESRKQDQSSVRFADIERDNTFSNVRHEESKIPLISEKIVEILGYSLKFEGVPDDLFFLTSLVNHRENSWI
jgi:hypothetical protein